VSGPARWQALLTYRKQGQLRYLSHLDVARALERALRRAKVAVAYSAGFHQRMRLTLGPPLPVGAEGLDERAAVLLTERRDAASLRVALNAQLPPELAVTKVVVQEPSSASPFAALGRATYLAEILGEPPVSLRELEAALQAALAAPHLFLPASENQPAALDVRPRIYDLAAVEEGGRLQMKMTLGVAQDNYLSPEHCLAAVAQFLPRPGTLAWRRLVRTAFA
jgi:radical SAM-linked protein